MSVPWPLAHDPVFPSRDEMLDVDAMRARLAAAFGVGVSACTRVRATYRPGTSLKVLYRAETDAGSRLIAARVFPFGRSAAAWSTARERTAASPDRVVAHVPDLDSVFWAFPYDRKLHSLGTLVDWPHAATPGTGARWTTAGLVAYTPEKCATARCVDDQGRTVAYAKAYADDTGALTGRAHDLLARHGVAVPRVLGYSVPYRILFVDAVSGRTLSVLASRERVQGFHAYGRSLATLHRVSPPRSLPAFTRLDEATTAGAADTIARLCPALAVRVKHLAHTLMLAKVVGQPAACLHGDAHFKNAVFTGRGVTLIDLDQVSQGQPAHELGSVLAALEYEAIVGRMTTTVARDLARICLEGYATARPLPAASTLAVSTATALLTERAMRALTRLRFDGLMRLDAVVARAQALASVTADNAWTPTVRGDRR